MAITSVSGGTTLVKIKVDYRAEDIADIESNLPNSTYNEKVFKINTGGYVYVDGNGNVRSVGVNEINPADSSTDGPVSVVSQRYDVPIFINNNNHNIDPKGSGNIDNVNFIVVRSDANGRRFTGLVKPLLSKGKTVYLYNDSDNSVSIRSLDPNSSAGNRFNLDGNKTLQGRSGMLLWYDDIDGQWKRI